MTSVQAGEADVVSIGYDGFTSISRTSGASRERLRNRSCSLEARFRIEIPGGV